MLKKEENHFSYSQCALTLIQFPCIFSSYNNEDSHCAILFAIFCKHKVTFFMLSYNLLQIEAFQDMQGENKHLKILS